MDKLKKLWRFARGDAYYERLFQEGGDYKVNWFIDWIMRQPLGCFLRWRIWQYIK